MLQRIIRFGTCISLRKLSSFPRLLSRFLLRCETWIGLTIFCFLLGILSLDDSSQHDEHLEYKYVKFNLSNNYFMSVTQTQLNRVQFLVDNEKCRIPEMSPRDPSVVPFLKFVPPFKCNQLNVTYVKDQYVIINEKILKHMGYRHVNDISCCYHTINRVQQSEKDIDKEADNGFQQSTKCYPMGTITQPKNDFISVTCTSNFFFWSKTIYKNFHLIANFAKKAPNNISRKLAFWENCLKENGFYCDYIRKNGRPPNVLLIGLDSTSRLNFHRQMPRSKELLEKTLEAVEMKGYTKVEENTFPNFVPLISSYSEEELTEICYPTQWVPQDKCPYMWREFSKLNYLTAHLEDSPRISIFNYMKTGFVKSPTDFYLRPIMLAAYTDKDKLAWTRKCIGYQRPDEMILDYVVDLASLSESKGIPYFITTWLTDLTHDNMNNLQRMDSVMENTLMKLQEKGLLENTVLLLLGDHGYRFTEVRGTATGWYEDKLPAMFIKLPDKLTKQRPSWLEGLRYNSNELTTPYNVHATIREILRTVVVTKDVNGKLLNNTIAVPNLSPNVTPQSPSYLRRGLSLLEKLPQRSCEEAGIPKEHCACYTPVAYTTNQTLIRMGTEAVVNSINDKLPSVCSPLKIDTIIASAIMTKAIEEQRISSSSSLSTPNGVTRKFIPTAEFVFAFKSRPGGFKFEGMTTFDGKTGRFMNVSNVLRINKKHSYTGCLDDKNIRFLLMCHCKSSPSHSHWSKFW